MAKGAHLTEEVINLIAQIHFENIDWGPTKIHAKLLKKLKERGLHKIFGSAWPGVSVVALQLKTIRGKENSRAGVDLEDSPWSVSALALADYDIPPEALPVVMNAWAKAIVDNEPLTIRQVKWIARLHHIYKGDTDISLEWLTVKASDYASQEKAIKLTGAYPDKPQNMRWLWFGDALLYLDCLDKSDRGETALAKRIMAMYGIKYEVKGGKSK